MWTALISALALVFTSAATILLTKQKERDAVWRAKKLAYYEEFIGATSGIVDQPAPSETEVRFATATNNLHLIGSPGVIRALHAYTDEIAVSNRANASAERHDILWSRLVWEIRADLNDPPSKQPDEFQARLWASGFAAEPSQ